MRSDPATRFSLLESMLLIRAHGRASASRSGGAGATAGREAVIAGVLQALGGRNRVFGSRCSPALLALLGRGQPMASASDVVAVFCGDAEVDARRFGRPAPLLYVRESAAWAGTAGSALTSLAADGSDAEAVHAAAAELVAGIHADGRPRLLELISSHAPGEADGQDYVDADSLQPWQQRDPIAILCARLIAEGAADPGELMHLHQRTAAEAEAAVACAAAAARPQPRPVEPAVCA